MFGEYDAEYQKEEENNAKNHIKKLARVVRTSRNGASGIPKMFVLFNASDRPNTEKEIRFMGKQPQKEI